MPLMGASPPEPWPGVWAVPGDEGEAVSAAAAPVADGCATTAAEASVMTAADEKPATMTAEKPPAVTDGKPSAVTGDECATKIAEKSSAVTAEESAAGPAEESAAGPAEEREAAWSAEEREAARPPCSAGCPTVCMVTMPNSRAANSTNCPQLTPLLRTAPAIRATLPPPGIRTSGGPARPTSPPERENGRRAARVPRSQPRE